MLSLLLLNYIIITVKKIWREMMSKLGVKIFIIDSIDLLIKFFLLLVDVDKLIL